MDPTTGSGPGCDRARAAGPGGSIHGTSGSTTPRSDPPDIRPDVQAGSTDQNIATVLEYYERQEQQISRSQRLLDRLSRFIGRPVFLGTIVLVVAGWLLVNGVLAASGALPFDPAPYFWLQGMVGLSALLTTTVVLISQNRLVKLAEQRAHLELKIALLTEQKAAKLIHLIEELRRDLPNVRDRHDSDAALLQQPMNPGLVLAALDERSSQAERPVSPATP